MFPSDGFPWFPQPKVWQLINPGKNQGEWVKTWPVSVKLWIHTMPSQKGKRIKNIGSNIIFDGTLRVYGMFDLGNIYSSTRLPIPRTWFSRTAYRYPSISTSQGHLGFWSIAIGLQSGMDVWNHALWSWLNHSVEEITYWRGSLKKSRKQFRNRLSVAENTFNAIQPRLLIDEEVHSTLKSLFLSYLDSFFGDSMHIFRIYQIQIRGR